MIWLSKIIQVFKIKDLRKKILFVLFAFVVFRLMANIPIPGISAEDLRSLSEGSGGAFGGMFDLLNVFTGGALEKLSVVMLGLGPYITGVIVLQLLTMIFPQLERIYKEEGEAGKRKFNQWGRILTVPFAAIQSFAMLSLLQQQGLISNMDGASLLISIISVIAGSIVLMWIGELVTERGIGNGVSLLIFAGIVAAVPANIAQLVAYWDPTKLFAYVGFFFLALVIVAAVVLINEGRRNIPVSYAKRVRGNKMYGGSNTYLPLNVNPAGVIPIIFALSLMMIPQMVGNFFANSAGAIGTFAVFLASASTNPWIYGGFYFLLVVAFTYFYTAVTFDPKAIATNLQKMGGFIPGIRPGQSTANFMYFILNRVLLVGAMFLGLIAVAPQIVAGLTGVSGFTFLVGGTSLLIVVSVVLETIRQIKAQLQMREYDNF